MKLSKNSKHLLQSTLVITTLFVPQKWVLITCGRYNGYSSCIGDWFIGDYMAGHFNGSLYYEWSLYQASTVFNFKERVSFISDPFYCLAYKPHTHS